MILLNCCHKNLEVLRLKPFCLLCLDCKKAFFLDDARELLGYDLIDALEERGKIVILSYKKTSKGIKAIKLKNKLKKYGLST